MSVRVSTTTSTTVAPGTTTTTTTTGTTTAVNSATQKAPTLYTTTSTTPLVSPSAAQTRPFHSLRKKAKQRAEAVSSLIARSAVGVTIPSTPLAFPQQPDTLDMGTEITFASQTNALSTHRSNYSDVSSYVSVTDYPPMSTKSSTKVNFKRVLPNN